MPYDVFTWMHAHFFQIRLPIPRRRTIVLLLIPLRLLRIGARQRQLLARSRSVALNLRSEQCTMRPRACAPWRCTRSRYRSHGVLMRNRRFLFPFLVATVALAATSGCEDVAVSIPPQGMQCDAPTMLCKCTGSVADGSFKCTTPAQGEFVAPDEGICIDNTTDQMCGITKCEDYNGTEICSIGKTCDATTSAPKCVCSDGSFETPDGTCAKPNSLDYCGINANHQGSACVSAQQLCNGTECVCISPYYQCDAASSELKCTDLSNDPQNCGFCGNQCQTLDENAVCKDYKCTCPDGYIQCNGKCIDPKTSPNYCGATDSCTGDAKGTICSTNQICSDGTCQCEPDTININFGNPDAPIQCVKIDNNSEDYIKICGYTHSNSTYQDCSTIENATCQASGLNKYHCGCEQNTFPIYETGDDGIEKLIACMPQNLKLNTNTHACQYTGEINGLHQYVDCDLPCDEKDPNKTPHCDPKIDLQTFHSCIENECSPTCGSKKTKCQKRAIDPETGKYDSKFNGVKCIDNDRLSRKKYINKDLVICECAAAPSTDLEETCLPVVDPPDKATNPAATTLHSLNHCSDYYDSCPARGLSQCKETEKDGKIVYSCACSDDKITIQRDDRIECIPKDYPLLHLTCTESDGNYTCQCMDGYFDQDNTFANGCELYAANHTEKCGKGGKDTNTTNCNDSLQKHNAQFASCNNGTCIYQSCNDGYGNCNQKLEDGCETELSSLDHCGNCYAKCDLKCADKTSCTNQCATSTSHPGEKACCVTGELDKSVAYEQITCCEGYKLYRYDHKLIPSCLKSSHYGCFDKAPTNKADCWSEVTPR